MTTPKMREQFDGVGRVLATVTGRLDGKVHAEPLEVYDDSEDENGGHEVHEVGQVLPVEGLSQSSHLVLAGGQQVEEGNHSTLELGSTASVHGVTAPSNSVPRPVFTVAGENDFQTMVSQMLVAMKREIPDPRP